MIKVKCGNRARPWSNRTGVLVRIRQDTRGAHTKKRPCEDTGEQNGGICEPRREPSGETKPADTWILGLQSCEEINVCSLSHQIWRVLLWQPKQIHCCCFSVTKSCSTLCNPMNCSTPGFAVSHHPSEFAQTHVHWVSNAIQPFHPLLPASPLAFNLCQQRGLFQWVSSSHQVGNTGASASVLPMNIQDWFPLELTDLIPLQSHGLSGVFSSTTVWKHRFFSTQPSLWSNSHICT